MKAFLPNLLTLLNLLSGCIAVIYALQNELSVAAWFVFLGIFFDFFDGFLARKLKVESALGLQLDSLADMVTSGLVPGLVMYQLMHEALNETWNFENLLPYFGLLITVASAYRLAHFNISKTHNNHFKGLPTPANAILILSLPLILNHPSQIIYAKFILNPWFLFGLTLLSAFLLNAPLKLMTLKFKSLHFSDNIEKFIFLVLSFVVLCFFKYAGILLSIFFYISISLIRPPKDV